MSKEMSNWLKTGSFNEKDEYFKPSRMRER